MNRFADKVVIITGAGSGIGKACAERLGEEGGKLCCLDVSAPALEALSDELTGKGIDHITGCCDVSDEAQVNEAVAECAARFGKIDALVYVAGILIGIFLFSELFSRFEPWYEGGFMGYLTVMDAFEISPYVFVFGFTLLAVTAFAISDRIRKRVKKVVY